MNNNPSHNDDPNPSSMLPGAVSDDDIMVFRSSDMRWSRVAGDPQFEIDEPGKYTVLHESDEEIVLFRHVTAR